MAINPQAVRGPVTAVPVVAGKGVRLREDIENNRVVAEVDETELYASNDGGTGITLSETPMNFERLKIFFGTSRNGSAGANIGMSYMEVLTSTLEGGRQGDPSVGYLTLTGFFYGNNSGQSNPYITCGQYTGCNTKNWTRGTNGSLFKIADATASLNSQWIVIYKVIGVHRVASA